MASSTIKKLKELQAEIQANTQKQAEKAALRANPNEQARRNTPKLLSRVYKALSDKVYTSYGLDDSVELYLGSHELRCAFGAERTAIREMFQEACGLRISDEKCANDCCIKLDLSGQAKICDGVDENGKLTILPFPTLLEENKRRQECWKQNLLALAKQVIDIAVECLKTTPNKHYGIPEMLTIWQRYVSKGRKEDRNPFDGQFSMNGIMASWQNLTAHQLSELTEETNKILSGGQISISTISGHTRAEIMRRPEKKIENPYYDYRKFYSSYDEVTPELQEVFDAIAKNVHLLAAESQVRCLTSQRKLIFETWSDNELDYHKLQRIKGNLHEQHLLDSLNKKLCGIKVTNMAFLCDQRKVKTCIYSSDTRTEFFNHRIEFSAEMDETSTDPMVQSQLRLEDAIKNIQEQQLSYIADQLIDMVITEARAYMKYGGRPEEGRLGANQEFFTMELQNIASDQLKEVVGYYWYDVTIDMRKVNQNKAFMQRLEEAIEQRSDGMVKMDTRNYRYELHFSDNP